MGDFVIFMAFSEYLNWIYGKTKVVSTAMQSSSVFPYIQFKYSEKAIKNDEISHLICRLLSKKSNCDRNFVKFLWPSQNIWILITQKHLDQIGSTLCIDIQIFNFIQAIIWFFIVATGQKFKYSWAGLKQKNVFFITLIQV